MHKKILIVIGITILFLGTCIAPTDAIDTVKKQSTLVSDGNTLYAGGSGEGNYSSIQEAIDDASNDDTVYVYNGTYYENVVIDRSLNLIGEDKNITIIDGMKKDDVIRVDSNCKGGAFICGFTLMNCGVTSGICAGVFLDNSDGHKICNNIFINNTITANNKGMQIYSSNNNTIYNNSFKDNTNAINIYSGNNNSIFNNLLSNNNENAIIVNRGDNNSIFNNLISGNPLAIELDIGCENNSIFNNNINGNGRSIDLYFSSNNKIFMNTINNSHSGIKLLYSEQEWGYTSNNRVFENTISNIGYQYALRTNNASNNFIYHNNFIKNHDNNVDDSCNNSWDDGYPSGGNYWDDYTGNDSNGDGIGDTPYPIPGGDNEDRYPLMEPWNLTPPVANFIYNVEESPVMFDASSSYDIDGEIISYEWDFGDGTTGTGEIIYHKYCTNGTYDVTLTVRDDDGLTGNITKCIDVLLANNPPTIEFYGPFRGRPNVRYEYVFIIKDPDGDENFLYIDWGDGNYSDWSGPYGSGNSTKINHTWELKGTYILKANLKDICGKSYWATFKVEITRTRTSSYRWHEWLMERFPLLERLLNLIR